MTVTIGKRNLELAKTTLKADDALDYASPEGKALTPPSGKPYNVIIDGTVGLPYARASKEMTPSSIIVRCAPSPGVMLERLFRKVLFSKKAVDVLFTTGNGKDLDILADLVTKGVLTILIDSEYTFDNLPEAWTKVAAGRVTGKIVVKY